MKKTVEFSEEAIGMVNEGLDKIRTICHKGLFGNAPKAMMDIQLEVTALKKLILEQGVINGNEDQA